MSIRIKSAGMQTTLQAGPRRGMRHLGVPSGGAADPLSMALANRLLDNAFLAPALETTLTGMSFQALTDVSIAITGAAAECSVAGDSVNVHEVIHVAAGAEVVVGPAQSGVRSYIAVADGFVADEMLGSASTYVPAGLGGFEGRALRRGDVIGLIDGKRKAAAQTTPAEFRPLTPEIWTLRCCRSLETGLLATDSSLFNTRFTIGERNDRMGVQLVAARTAIESQGRMESAAVFPGIVQCPEDGQPFLLSVDAQTTGGYPRIAKVARGDLHQIGQLRSGNRLTFIERTVEEARQELLDKQAYWRPWLAEVRTVI